MSAPSRDAFGPTFSTAEVLDTPLLEATVIFVDLDLVEADPA